jgi:hypothetical protein
MKSSYLSESHVDICSDLSGRDEALKFGASSRGKSKQMV